MKIMLQNHTFYPILGGIENYLYHVSKTLKEMGHHPIIICEKHDHRLSDFENYEGIKIIRHPYYNISKPMLFMKPKIISEQLKHFISEYVWDIDLIISRYPHYCFATCSLSLDIPIFYVPGTVYWKYMKRCSENFTWKEKIFNSLWKPIFDHLENKSIVLSNKVITLSKHISISLARYYDLDPNRFIINKPGVDINRFRNLNKLVEIKREFNIAKDSIIVLYVGRLSSEKNVGRLIKDFCNIKRKNIHLLIVGYGPERLSLEQLARGLKKTGEITFVGRRKDVERFYGAADIFVIPSMYEAFGQVILEAMAAGLPCIAFKKVLPRYEVASEEIIEDGVNGFCVNPHNGEEFRERLEYLIDHPNIRKRMGGEGRRTCERSFNWGDHVRRLLDLM